MLKTNPYVPTAGQCENRDMVGNSKQKSPLVTDIFQLKSKLLGFLDMPWPNGIALNFSYDSSSGNREMGMKFHINFIRNINTKSQIVLWITLAAETLQAMELQ